MSANLPTVLIVDDEPRSLETLRRTLEEEFDVLTAQSAQAAEALLEKEWVHAILCDQRMPGETGVEFLSRVRESWPDVVRIITSGFTDADAPNAYSWCKAPRYDGDVVEVGALARQLIDGHPLVRAMVSRCGGNVCDRVVARLLELARVVPVMEKWARAIRIGDTFCDHAPLPDEAQGLGLVQAARSSLGHWVQIKRGRILSYQIVAPTTWNFSPRDEQGKPGALEQALIGTEVDNDAVDAVAIQHIVRSFDACMVCTVH